MLPLAISVGVAVFPHDDDSYETLLATADSRMYRDKTRRKRNRAGAPTVDEEPPRSASGGLTDGALKRSAIGIV